MASVSDARATHPLGLRLALLAALLAAGLLAVPSPAWAAGKGAQESAEARRARVSPYARFARAQAAGGKGMVGIAPSHPGRAQREKAGYRSGVNPARRSR